MPAAPLKPLNVLFPLHIQVIIKYYRCLGSNVKEIDETPVPESESELSIQEEISLLRLFIDDDLDNWMKKIELRVANLETQRTPQDENDDPEWFS